jgi:enamine deaminase RidA (YjgF/YER057c/UK114 family)
VASGLTGAVIYAKDMARVAAFYQQVCGLQPAGGDNSHRVLLAGESQLIVHAIPARDADGIAIAQPPARREDMPIKPVFGVASLAAARACACALGGVLDPVACEWAYVGQDQTRTLCDGHDPEGNVFQLWQVAGAAVGAVAATTAVVVRRRISSGSRFEADIGYSRAIVVGDWVFVSGTTGFDYAAMTISDDVVEQAAQCLRNIDAALTEAGASLADVVRVHYLLPRTEDFEPCWPVLRAAFGEVRPAATMLQAGLADPRMRIEIEVTALRRDAGAQA